MAYIDIINVEKKYHTPNGEIFALKDITFSVDKGEFISIVGPSGCGKSTILSIIAGLVKPSKGDVLVNTYNYKEYKNEIGYMFQKDHLFEWRTVKDNIYLGLEIREQLTKENKEYAEVLLKKYGLYEFKDNYPSQLSGGMRQRVALIRTLVLKPQILLLDEPFSALDYQTRLNISDEIYKILKDENITTIQVTHDISEAVSMSDRVITLSNIPAVIKNIYSIKFDDVEIRSPLNYRKSSLFVTYFNQIWGDLNE